jgi:hypothetical protein
VHPNNYWGTLRIGQQSTLIPTSPMEMVFPNDPGVPRGLIQTDKTNFAPRIGFVWDPFGNGRTSVRGAYANFLATLGNLDNRRLLEPGFGNDTKISSQGNSSYNWLQVQVNKRFRRRFEASGACTWSRSPVSAISLGGAVPNIDLHTQWGFPISLPNTAHLMGWDLPGLRGSEPALRPGAGGGQFNGNVPLRSGSVINVTTGADKALSGTSNQRPNVNGNPILFGDRTRAAGTR